MTRGPGPLTRALTGPDGYLFGAGHRYRPQGCPWRGVEHPRPEHPPKFEFAAPIGQWLHNRFQREEPTFALLAGWPVW